MAKRKVLHTDTPWAVQAEPIKTKYEGMLELLRVADNTVGFSGNMYLITDGSKYPALTGFGPTSEANARHIVKCVNNYARLKAVLRKMIDAEDCSRDAPGILFDAAQEADALLAELDKGDE